jgi:hypothetical protein
LVKSSNVPVRVHRVQRNIARRAGERSADQLAGQPHDLRRLFDFGTGVSVPDPRIGRQHLHALSFQHDERGFVNGSHLIIGEYLHRREGVAQMTIWARAVEDRMAGIGASGSASVASANRLFRLFQVLLRA